MSSPALSLSGLSCIRLYPHTSMIRLLQQRAGVHITLCAFTNSENPAVAVNLLLHGGTINPPGLVLCAAEDVEGEGPARVEISI